MPRRINQAFTAQKIMKHANSAALMPSTGSGRCCDGSNPITEAAVAWIAAPPTQVWMPNQPQATKPRINAGMFDPRVPKAARNNTGNGIP